MRVIGLTGSIACGKSTVSAFLRQQPDCRVVDGDALSRRITRPEGSALPAIRQAFGDRVFLPDGSLNRKILGQLIFSDDAARETLDELMAPLLEEETIRSLDSARAAGATLCFLDFPLLFEKGYDRLCDTIWCVWLPEEKQLERLMARDHLTEAEARSRMRAVLSSDEKAKRSPVVIDNSGSITDTLQILPDLLEKERVLADERTSGRRRRADRYSSQEMSTLSDTEAPTVLPATPNPTASSVSAASPAGMDRPEAARKSSHSCRRKSTWRMPVWLLSLLIGCSVLLLVSITAFWLMRGYLARREEQHIAEQQAIHDNYPLSWRDLIEQYAREYNLEPAFVAAIIRNESSFDPKAESSVGARGLMQLMPDTAEWVAGKLKIRDYAFDRMWDPESNIRFGCWYLNYLSNLFRGDPVCVACAYHAGQGTVSSWLSNPSYSADGVTLSLSSLSDGPTKTYAGRVIRAYGIYQALYFEDAVPVPDSGTDAELLFRPGFQCGKQSGRWHPEHQNTDNPSAFSVGAGLSVDL